MLDRPRFLDADQEERGLRDENAGSRFSAYAHWHLAFR